MRSFFLRYSKDQRGAHIVEMSFAIGLFALVAAFGFFSMGEALSEYYVTMKDNFASGVSFAGDPVPTDSGGSGGSGGNGNGNGPP